MPLYNTKAHFLYRQFFLTPSTPPPTLPLSGKSGLITGSNTGIGYEAASQLLSLSPDSYWHSLLSKLNDEKNFIATDRYYSSKLLQQLFFHELVRRGSKEAEGKGATLNLVNPGFCYSLDLQRGAPSVVGKILGG
ncbi:uncharacterized protein BDV14DRAFT_196948 [Aspergillus stella-maris]|uniref:uncharacterized protein n=1 Tax=Aspergillus stella-maris TaxID=1810926 RepID=UPI003CCD8B51